ncbi:MAG: 3D domain-containing protein [Myxococcota bacterium]
MRQATLLLALALAAAPSAEARERGDVDFPEKLPESPKERRCCGYPLGEYKLSFYWLSYERDYAAEAYDTPVFTIEGWLVGMFPRRFVEELTMEGTAVLADGRVLNYAGRCRYGTGICFQACDRAAFPVGIGVRGRSLVPYRSVAVDPAVVPIGEPLYFPELDGIELPDGTLHDGCVRADDQGGAIRKREIDFFVASYDEFKKIADAIWWRMKVTPHVEEPRCRYLLDTPPSPPSPPPPIARR